MKAKFNKAGKEIGWAAHSWNPVSGCLGPGADGKHCPYCYVKAMADRFHQDFKPTFHLDRLEAPSNTPLPKKGNTRVFVCSMGELFGPWVPHEWIEKIFNSARTNPQWTFLFLTKCPERLPTLDWPSNAWIGVTIDRQDRVDGALEAFHGLRNNGVKNNLFVSCEPLLESVEMPDVLWWRLNWLIIGALSKGKTKIQPQKEWVEYLIGWASQYGIPVWMKDNLEYRIQRIPYG